MISSRKLGKTAGAAAVAVASAAGVFIFTATSTEAAPAECETREARVFATTLLRTAPSVTSASIQEIPANTFLAMTDTQLNIDEDADYLDNYGYGWIQVDVDGQQGFVHKKYADGPIVSTRACGDTQPLPVPEDLQQEIVRTGM